MPTDECDFFATCARGLEPVLADELRSLGATTVEPGRGGVKFSGPPELVYRANLYLRTAVRVLRPILVTEVRSPEELYDAVRTIRWTDYLTPDHTLAVDCNVRDSALTHSHYAALKTKDAICDWFVDQCGRRPSVDTENPLIGFNLHIHQDMMTLSLDSSGESLHKRGYRPIQTKAPLNEALAAGILQLSGWKPDQPLIDPMCGSGTILIEAAWLALNRPPGLTRKRFGFMGWLDFDIATWTRIRDEGRAAVRKTLPAPMEGSDLRSDAIQHARQNAKTAGVGHLLKFVRQDACARKAEGPPGWLIMNPPYGERIGERKEVERLYGDLARRLPEHWVGWHVAILSGNARLGELMKAKPLVSHPLYNGQLKCQLVVYRF